MKFGKYFITLLFELIAPTWLVVSFNLAVGGNSQKANSNTISYEIGG